VTADASLTNPGRGFSAQTVDAPIVQLYPCPKARADSMQNFLLLGARKRPSSYSNIVLEPLAVDLLFPFHCVVQQHVAYGWALRLQIVTCCGIMLLRCLKGMVGQTSQFSNIRGPGERTLCYIRARTVICWHCCCGAPGSPSRQRRSCLKAGVNGSGTVASFHSTNLGMMLPS
jgi:hypothetical protein